MNHRTARPTNHRPLGPKRNKPRLSTRIPKIITLQAATREPGSAEVSRTQRNVMSDSPEQPQARNPSNSAELDQQRREYLAALDKSADDLPDMADPQEWRDAPKEGGGA